MGTKKTSHLIKRDLINLRTFDIIKAQIKGQPQKEIAVMSMNDVAILWDEWTGRYGASKESVKDFCNHYATSYEECMALYELLSDVIEEEA